MLITLDKWKSIWFFLLIFLLQDDGILYGIIQANSIWLFLVTKFYIDDHHYLILLSTKNSDHFFLLSKFLLIFYLYVFFQLFIVQLMYKKCFIIEWDWHLVYMDSKCHKFECFCWDSIFAFVYELLSTQHTCFFVFDSLNES